VPDLLVAGIALGAIYGLAGLSFVMVFNATSVVNFAHGDLIVIGGMVAAYLATSMGLHPLVAIGGVVAVLVPIGVALEVFTFRPLRDKPFASVFTISVAVSIILSSGLLIVLGPQPRTIPPLVAGAIEIGAFTIKWHSLIIVVTTGVLVVAQWWLFQRTRLGFRLRATAEDPTTARLMGISVHRMTATTFGLASAYAGIAGVLLAPVIFLSSTTGSTLILKIFVAVVIGGFGSIAGAVVGGLVLGIFEIMTSAYVSSAYANAIVFALLFAILIVRPRGILGKVQTRV
jgi:branched-chain amino acid transport system permease protein